MLAWAYLVKMAHSMGEMPMDMSAIVILVASRVSGGLMLVVGLVIALGEISGP